MPPMMQVMAMAMMNTQPMMTKAMPDIARKSAMGISPPLHKSDLRRNSAWVSGIQSSLPSESIAHAGIMKLEWTK